MIINIYRNLSILFFGNISISHLFIKLPKKIIFLNKFYKYQTNILKKIWLDINILNIKAQIIYDS